MSYNPQVPVVEQEEARPLVDWVLRELQAIEREFSMQDFVQLKKWHTPPQKLTEGLVVLADGTNWNPGSGAGVYAYHSGVWNKLG